MEGFASLEVEDAAELMRVMGHGVRLRLLMALVDGELSVGEIEAVTGIQQPGLSQQLSVLRKADLVTTRRESKQIFYATNQDRIGQLCGTIGWIHKDESAQGECAMSIEAARLRKLGSFARFARTA
jgi:DNA-binding transcriptional ArsR family regulator